MAEHGQPIQSPAALSLRYRLQIGRSGPVAERIAAILARHGGVRLDSGEVGIYELPSEAAYNAALIAVRSIHGWTSVEPRY
jgi:hypothetical protein